MMLDALARQAGPDPLATAVAQHADMVYAACRRVLGNDAEAADVAQETFFHFLKNYGRIRGSIGAWLHHVATSRSIDLMRRNTSRRRREEAYMAEAQSEPDTWREVEPLVDEALEELPAVAREVLVLHYLERQSMTAIGLRLGLSQPTVSRRVAAALESLRAVLSEKGVLVGGAGLGTLLTGTAQSAPALLSQALGKMVLTHAATGGVGTGTSLLSLVGGGAKAAATAATAILLIGIGYLALVPRRAERPAVTNAPVQAVTFGYSTSIVWTAGPGGQGLRIFTSGTNYAVTNLGPATTGQPEGALPPPRP